MAAVFQQQLREVGIALDIRSFEFATFFSDITHGEFQVYSLRWIGGNEDPDIFEYAFDSARIIPNGANRQYYSNPQVDALIAKAGGELDQNTRKQDYAEIQQILAEDLPYINLWYFDNVMVYSKRVRGLEMNPSGQLRLSADGGADEIGSGIKTFTTEDTQGHAERYRENHNLAPSSPEKPAEGRIEARSTAELTSHFLLTSKTDADFIYWRYFWSSRTHYRA